MTDILNRCYAVVLAGGSGTRFWPRSRIKSPKQLCKIGDPNLTMLEVTLKRLDDFIPKNRRIIVTHKDQYEKTKEIASNACAHILAEPEARNTACALGLANLWVEKIHSESMTPIMISLHADAVISPTDSFQKVLLDAARVAEQDKLTLVGVEPNSPHTGYGYIEMGEATSDKLGYNVNSFREKPDLETAKKFLDSGKFVWNSGIFVWKTTTLNQALNENVPKILELLKPVVKNCNEDQLLAGLSEIYSQIPKISIDNGVLETAKNLAVLAGKFSWQDVGSWPSLNEVFETDESGNYISGNIFSLNNGGCTLDSDGRLTACIGLQDIIVVNDGNATLVCHKDQAQDVKKIVEHLKQKALSEYL